MSLDLNSSNVEYKNNKVIIKSIPKDGENLSVFMRPGDEVIFEIKGLNFEELEYILVGGDIIISFYGEGVLTFPSLGLMGFSSNPPKFNFGDNKIFSVDNILSKIEEINELPITSVDASFKIVTGSDEVGSAPSGVQVVVVSQNESTTGGASKGQEFPQGHVTSNSISQLDVISKSTPTSDPFMESMPKNDYDGYKQDENLVPPPNVELTPDDGGGSTTPDTTPGAGDPVPKAQFDFTATAHQVTFSETMDANGAPLILGGGGSLLGYENASQTNQVETETIDMSKRSEDMIIRAENSTYFNNDGLTTSYLSRVLRFEPVEAENYIVKSFTLTGLPTGVKLLHKDGTEIIGGTISRDDFVFKDTEGKIVEFTIKYSSTNDPFNISIKANYELDSSYSGPELPQTQEHANNYTIALKDIANDSDGSDYVYKKEDYTDGADEGFILSKEPNTNTIIDGSGNSIIVGGLGTDIVYDGAGDDTIYLSGGSDIVYGGAGHNTIYGNTYLKEDGTTTDDYSNAQDRNKVSYSEVQSYTMAELVYLKTKGYISDKEYQVLSGSYKKVNIDDVEVDEDGNIIGDEVIVEDTLENEMLLHYNGVYVDLNGFNIDTNNPDVKINALSKFATRDEFHFIYNELGDIDSVLTNPDSDLKNGLDNLQQIGQDKFHDIVDIDGSAYNDTIYGNSSNNILRGLEGSDILDGRSANNKLYGGAGDDMLYSGSGNDYLDGGDGTDTVNYQNATSGVTVRLDKPKGDEFDDYATGYGEDKLISIENVIGSNQNDVIFGSNSTNYLEGMDGNDLIFSGGGINFIDGGSGTDKISYYYQEYIAASGDPNNPDYVKYLRDIKGITVTMGADFVMLKETATGKLIDLVKDIEQVGGTTGNDVIIGKNGVNQTFWGYEGNDDLRGGNGNDHLYGGAGNDILRPGRGVDFSDGGEGVDFLNLHYDTLRDSSVQRIRLNDDGTVQYTIDNGATWHNGYLTPESYVNTAGGVIVSKLSTAINIEGLQGSGGNDYIIGNIHDNRILGGDGHDIIYGTAGNNTLRGGNGDDHIYGGTGNDIIYGDAGNDTIYGGGGDNIIYGHSVHAWNQLNQDTINGGTGANNTLNYSSASHGGFTLDMRTVGADGYYDVKFNASTSTSKKTLPDDAFDDKIKNIHNIVGSGAADTIYANDTGMTLDGWGGVDKLSGGDGDDTIIARNTAGEILDGGAGTDTLKLATTVDFRGRISVSNFEILDIGDYTAYFNLSDTGTYSQWEAKAFNKIVGGEKSSLYMASTGGGNIYDISNVDFRQFEGNLNFNASGTNDTLKMGENQSVKMTENYYNTFEKFEVGAGSTLEVNALNNGARTFHAHDRDFTGVDSTAKINLIGGNGNDTFFTNFEALLAGKLTIDGGSGSDTVDIRTDKISESISFDTDIFKNIEILKLDTFSETNTIVIDATVMRSWFEGDVFTLDLKDNNSQADKLTINNATVTDSDGVVITTGFMKGSIYDISFDSSNFELHIV